MSGRMVLVGLTMVSLLAACKVPHFGRMSYEEAAVELVRLVEGGLAAGSKDSLGLPNPQVRAAPCGDSDEIEAYPHYQYHFPLEMLGPDPDAFADRVAEYWKSEDLELIPDDLIPGIHGSFAQNGDFNLHVFANRNTGMALVSGSGPCVPKPED